MMLITPSGTGKTVGTGVGLGVAVGIAVGEGNGVGEEDMSTSGVPTVGTVVSVASGVSLGGFAVGELPPQATRELPNSTINETTNSDFFIHSDRVSDPRHAGPS
jgi:hypothetical protein